MRLQRCCRACSVQLSPWPAAERTPNAAAMPCAARAADPAHPPCPPAASAPAQGVARHCLGKQRQCRGTWPAQSPAGGRCQSRAADRPAPRRTACMRHSWIASLDAASRGGQHTHRTAACEPNPAKPSDSLRRPASQAHHCTPAPRNACTAAPAPLLPCAAQLKVPSGATPLCTGSSFSRSIASASTACMAGCEAGRHRCGGQRCERAGRGLAGIRPHHACLSRQARLLPPSHQGCIRHERPATNLLGVQRCCECRRRGGEPANSGGRVAQGRRRRRCTSSRRYDRHPLPWSVGSYAAAGMRAARYRGGQERRHCLLRASWVAQTQWLWSRNSLITAS